MPSSHLTTLALLEQLTKEQRIRFIGSQCRSEWPAPLREMLDHVAELGEKKFDRFAAVSGETDSKPWTENTKNRAKVLVEKAKRSMQRNESSWRFACESIVFARLEAEVVCKNCRGRMWRSEIEATREDASKAALALLERQQKREPCRCPRMLRSQDQLEVAGLNRIFGHREDEMVPLPRAVANRLNKPFLKPDAIFGLRQTRNIENLLNDSRQEFQFGRAGVMKQVHELLGPSPISDVGDKLLFPFLVLEAKSGTSDCDWHSIHMQSAFPIKSFLDAQNRLRKATEGRSRWKQGPLVWFFANRGEDWQVHVAYLDGSGQSLDKSGGTECRVVKVWGGSIGTHDGALQLLLLVDYVFDWARDVYRECIIQELRILATCENDTVGENEADTDIFSTYQRDISEGFDQEVEEDLQQSASLQDEFVDRDTDEGVIRHATFIESKHFCLLITRDNVQNLLRSTTKIRAQKLSRRTLSQMHQSFILDFSTLSAIEKEWTGHARLATNIYFSGTKFYTVLSCVDYLSEEWHHVRELYVIAIEEDAWDDLVDAAELTQKIAKPPRPVSALHLDKESMITTLKKLQAGPLAETLLAAITRRSLKITIENICESSEDGASSPADSIVSESDTSMHAVAVPDDTKVRDIVLHLYQRIKLGRMEPEEPFFRLSKRLTQQHLQQFTVQSMPKTEESLQVSQDGCVILTCHRRGSGPELCFYITEGEPKMPDRPELYEMFRRTVETRDVYHTTLDNGSPNLNKVSERSKTPWNLKGTYGMFTKSFDLLRYLGELDEDEKFSKSRSPPYTQGSPRDITRSDLYLFTRNLVPWEDPRRAYDDIILGEQKGIARKRTIAERTFVIYKLMKCELDFWRVRKLLLTALGLPCCQTCAKTVANPVSVCEECALVRGDREVSTYFMRIMQGRSLLVDRQEEKSGEKHGQKPWISLVCGYPLLDEPFTDLNMLHHQTDRFSRWWDWKHDLEPESRRGTKRKRDPGEDMLYDGDFISRYLIWSRPGSIV